MDILGIITMSFITLAVTGGVIGFVGIYLHRDRIAITGVAMAIAGISVGVVSYLIVGWVLALGLG